ncbi:hypothetical protein TREES_T100021057 [Tupaia chinensis]|uniref:Uncharacterized protein n=1 Tax=Tupaia chinensis TaxID=246437 RepID=L9JEQ1_TUPCH|nr:hypothetical protein TREES_T100021057 [Tupaia chinensis]
MPCCTSEHGCAVPVTCTQEHVLHGSPSRTVGAKASPSVWELPSRGGRLGGASGNAGLDDQGLHAAKGANRKDCIICSISTNIALMMWKDTCLKARFLYSRSLSSLTLKAILHFRGERPVWAWVQTQAKPDTGSKRARAGLRAEVPGRSRALQDSCHTAKLIQRPEIGDVATISGYTVPTSARSSSAGRLPVGQEEASSGQNRKASWEWASRARSELQRSPLRVQAGRWQNVTTFFQLLNKIFDLKQLQHVICLKNIKVECTSPPAVCVVTERPAPAAQNRDASTPGCGTPERVMAENLHYYCASETANRVLKTEAPAALRSSSGTLLARQNHSAFSGREPSLEHGFPAAVYAELPPDAEAGQEVSGLCQREESTLLCTEEPERRSVCFYEPWDHRKFTT